MCIRDRDNPASHALQKKLGLTPAPEQVVWLHRPHGEDEDCLLYTSPADVG